MRQVQRHLKAQPQRPRLHRQRQRARKKAPEAGKGGEVSVKGDYNGHSTSTTSYGKTIMMNIRNKEYKNAGTCIGKDEPPADVKERRQDRVFTGKVGRYLKSFQQVEIEECKMTG